MINTTLFDYNDFMQFVCSEVKSTRECNAIMRNSSLMDKFYNDYLQYKKEEFMKKYDVKFIYKTDKEN